MIDMKTHDEVSTVVIEALWDFFGEETISRDDTRLLVEALAGLLYSIMLEASGHNSLAVKLGIIDLFSQMDTQYKESLKGATKH